MLDLPDIMSCKVCMDCMGKEVDKEDVTTPNEQPTPTPETDRVVQLLADQGIEIRPGLALDLLQHFESERNEWRGHAVEWQLENITLNTDVKNLVSERDTWKAMAKAATGFIRHKTDCVIWNDSQPKACDCGANDLRESIAEKSPASESQG